MEQALLYRSIRPSDSGASRCGHSSARHRAPPSKASRKSTRGVSKSDALKGFLDESSALKQTAYHLPSAPVTIRRRFPGQKLSNIVEAAGRCVSRVLPLDALLVRLIEERRVRWLRRLDGGRAQTQARDAPRRAPGPGCCDESRDAGLRNSRHAHPKVCQLCGSQSGAKVQCNAECILGEQPIMKSIMWPRRAEEGRYIQEEGAGKARRAVRGEGLGGEGGETRRSSRTRRPGRPSRCRRRSCRRCRRRSRRSR